MKGETTYRLIHFMSTAYPVYSPRLSECRVQFFSLSKIPLSRCSKGTIACASMRFVTGVSMTMNAAGACCLRASAKRNILHIDCMCSNIFPSNVRLSCTCLSASLRYRSGVARRGSRVVWLVPQSLCQRSFVENECLVSVKNTTRCANVVLSPSLRDYSKIFKLCIKY